MTCFPARNAAAESGTCSSFVAQTCTTSIAGSAIGRGSVTHADPLSGPTTSTPISRSASACLVPANPAPTTSARCGARPVPDGTRGTYRTIAEVAEIRPFRALRYDEAKAGLLADQICPPYDVIAEDLRGEPYAKSPYNFVRVEYAHDEPNEDRYRVASRSLAEWTERGILRRDAKAAFYGYDHVFTFRGKKYLRRGFFCALRLSPTGEGIVR